MTAVESASRNECVIAIIGTAGRKHDAARLCMQMYWSMVRVARQYVLKRVTAMHGSQQQVQLTLISGGSAWSDHVAVTLWMQLMDIIRAPGSK
jgi:hypothetical protein